MLARASSAPRSGERLAGRRRTRRRRAFIAFCTLILICLGVATYGLQQSAVRVARVEVFGLPADEAGADPSFVEYATRAMQGWYLGLVPRDSIFFFPERRIRADILAAREDVAAVSIFRSSFTGITIKVAGRAPIARWCGPAPTQEVEEYCYLFDANGYLYAAAADSTQTINPFVLYARLEGDTLEPLRATIVDAKELPSTFDFARELATLGSPVTRIVIRDGEVDDHLTSGTHVTYVLGDEQNAFTALVSSRESVNLADGSIEYVDLRFSGKVYLKRKQ